MEGAGGCALSLLILCLQDMKTPPKSQSLSTWDLHGGDPSFKQTLRSITSQIPSTCRDSSEEPTSVPLHPCQGSALWLHPPTPLCCSAPAELEASSELSPPFHQGQEGGRSSTRGPWCQLPRPRQSCAHVTSPGSCLYSWENVEKYL